MRPLLRLCLRDGLAAHAAARERRQRHLLFQSRQFVRLVRQLLVWPQRELRPRECLAYGSGCELAIECDGTLGATAFAPDPYEGFGASCEWQDAGDRRSIAPWLHLCEPRAL